MTKNEAEKKLPEYQYLVGKRFALKGAGYIVKVTSVSIVDDDGKCDIYCTATGEDKIGNITERISFFLGAYQSV